MPTCFRCRRLWAWAAGSALVALVLAWWLLMPTVQAWRFGKAVERGDGQAVRRLLAGEDENRIPWLFLGRAQLQYRCVRVSASNLLFGRRRVLLRWNESTVCTFHARPWGIELDYFFDW